MWQTEDLINGTAQKSEGVGDFYLIFGNPNYLDLLESISSREPQAT
jgi:hypothetical protein